MESSAFPCVIKGKKKGELDWGVVLFWMIEWKSNWLMGLWSVDPAWHGLPMTKNQQEKYRESLCTIETSLSMQQCLKQGYSSWRCGRGGKLDLVTWLQYKRNRESMKSNTMVPYFLPILSAGKRIHVSCATHAVLSRFSAIPSSDVARGLRSCEVQDRTMTKW